MSKDQTKTTVVSSTSFCSLLTIAFIVLKLCNVITWSWGWVLAPLWVPIVIIFTILIVLVLMMLAFSKK